MASAKTRTWTLRALSVLLGLFFLLSASGKLANGPTPAGDWDAQVVAWGYPAWVQQRLARRGVSA